MATVPNPVSLAFTSTSTNSVFMFWNPIGIADPPILRYNVKLYNNSTGKYVVDFTTTESSTFGRATIQDNVSLTGLDSGTVYTGSVIAVNAFGPSLATNKNVKTSGSFPSIRDDKTISQNMVSQRVSNFKLENNRVTGEINYLAESGFNPFYYNKPLTSIVIIKDESGNIRTVKTNTLNFSIVERDETITINEDVGNLNSIQVEFIVSKSLDQPVYFSQSKTQTITSSIVVPTPEPTPVVIPDGFHQMPDGSIMADNEMYNFIIESDGLVRMFRIGAVQYTEIKVKPENVTSYIDRNISRLLTEAERAIAYPRPEPTPTPTPEPTPTPTFCVNVYAIRDSGSVYSIGYPEITAAKVEELQQTQYVVFCNAATVPTEKQVRDFYGFTPVPPQVDTTINSTMVSQSIGSFVLKDGRITGEVLYIANQSFNPFYYNKPITSLVQIKSKSGVVIAMKSNNLNFTETQRDEKITIDESAGNFKELLIDFFVWDSPLSQIIFSETKQIQIVDETDVAPTDPFDPQPPTTTCPAGYHKDFSGKCVADDPVGEIPKDRLIETLKGFLFGTVALSLLARKY